MTNRLELNWNLDGFVDEQRYYCSETPIDLENLPEPVSVFAGDIRNYIDNTQRVIGENYYVRVSAIKNGIEKFSDEKVILFGIPDPQLSTVTLLMQFDESPMEDPISGVTWTLYGDAYVDTVDKKIGSGALHLSDAVTSYARSPVLTNMHTPNVSGKTITVEFWFKKTSSIGNAGAVCFQNADNPSDRYAFFMRSGANDFNVAVYTTSTSTFIDTKANLNLNEWVHFAYVEGGDGSSKLYINGIEKYNVYANNPITFWVRTIATLGQSGLDAEPFGGLIDGLRVSKFTRYTANFIPPDKPFASS